MSVDDQPAAKPATYGALFRTREFSALWLAEALSVAGDQLARVALSILVYDRTHSPALTGLAYALTFLPALFSGSLLSGLADRYPRRTVMVTCDLLSALMIASIAIPGTPIAVVCVGVIGMTLSNTLFKTARLALLPDIITGEKYVLGMAVRSMTQQTAQLIGFGLGGVLVAAINPSVGLAIDAVTFALSALCVRLGTGWRPASRDPKADRRVSLTRSMTEGLGIIWRDPLLRACTLFDWIIGLYVLPEAVAAPYADDIGGSATAVGILLAAIPAGSMVGDFAYSRFIPDPVRTRLVVPLVMLTGIALLPFVFSPGLWVAALLLAVSGLFSTYHIQVVSEFGRTVPPAGRAQAFGLSNSGLQTAQGLGLFGGGLLAEWFGPANAVVIAGVAGIAAAFAILPSWNKGLRLRTPQP